MSSQTTTMILIGVVGCCCVSAVTAGGLWAGNVFCDTANPDDQAVGMNCASVYERSPAPAPGPAPAPAPATAKSETFYVKGSAGNGNGYSLAKSAAASACLAVGAQNATTAQVTSAQVAGADWCATGWVSDSTSAMYPITTQLQSGCGNGSVGVKQYTPPDTMAGVNCYGPKPADGVNPLVLGFNQSKWSQFS